MNAAITINRTDVDGVPAFWVDTGRPTLSATLVVRAGLMDEPPARSGWLHLLEHVVMTGPEQHGLAVNGSVDLAFTTFDAEGDPAGASQKSSAEKHRRGSTQDDGCDRRRLL